jgi:chromosome segregation ATPase
VIILKGEQTAGVGPGTASKLLPALRERAEAALRQSADAQRQQAQHRREKLEQDLAGVRQRLADVREKQRKYRAATASISQFGDARYAGNNLRNQKQQYEQQLAGYRSRLKSIEPSASPLVAEWRGVVDLRQKQLDELKEQASAGKASADAVAAQERKAADAKSQLEAARRTASAEADSRRGRAGEVASLESQIEQAESQLKNVNDQLARIEDPKVLEMVEELPELQNEENRIRTELSEVMSRADQLRRAGDAGADVTIRVLDGKPDRQ